jgi:polysaccharide export outer membrane protein
MSSERRSCAFWLVAVATMLLALILGPGLSAQPGRSQVIGERDTIRLSVFEAAEFDGSFRVDERGEVNHPILGSVKIGGMSRAEAEFLFTELLEERYLQKGRATVSVEISETRSQAINVVGAVVKPGQLEFSGSWTLIEAITAAGGLTANHGDSIFVFRRSSNGLTDQIEISAHDLLTRADPMVNLPLAPLDLVNIPETVDVTLYCMGEVNNPGALTFKSNQRITLLAAIARAGGLTDRAAKKIIIQRQGDDGEQIRLEADYRSIFEGKSPDLDLEAGDVITVKVSFL